jgi:hypothetical protein
VPFDGLRLSLDRRSEVGPDVSRRDKEDEEDKPRQRMTKKELGYGTEETK